MGKTDATAEVERYIAIPSQATAYKIGALTIQRLRKKAEAELGPKFDIRDFHAQVLMTGALPLTILEQKIDRWIAEKKAVMKSMRIVTCARCPVAECGGRGPRTGSGASRASTIAIARARGAVQASDEGSLKRNPINALIRGDMRYAERARRLSLR